MSTSEGDEAMFEILESMESLIEAVETRADAHDEERLEGAAVY